MRIHAAVRTLLPICLLTLSLLATLYVNAGPIPGVRDPRMERMLRNAVNKPVGWVDAADLAKINRLEIPLPIDLHGLENCTALEELTLSSNQSVEEKNYPAAQLSSTKGWQRWMEKPSQFKYRMLEDVPNSPPSLEPLSQLPKLRYLSLHGPRDMDINALRQLPNLELLSVDTGDYFDMQLTPIDWTDVAQCRTLRRLWLRIGYDAVPSLAAATKLTNLTLTRNLPYEVPLDDYAVVDYSNLWNAPSLRTLTVDDRAFTKWNVTGQPLSLKTLILRGGSFGSLDGIATALNLEQLSIEGDSIDDLEEVAKLPALRDLELGLWSQEPMDLAPLALSPSLQNLELINPHGYDYSILLALCERDPKQELHLYIYLGGGSLPKQIRQCLDASNISIHDSAKDHFYINDTI